jgi:hypothetical protein
VCEFVSISHGINRGVATAAAAKGSALASSIHVVVGQPGNLKVWRRMLLFHRASSSFPRVKVGARNA